MKKRCWSVCIPSIRAVGSWVSGLGFRTRPLPTNCVNTKSAKTESSAMIFPRSAWACSPGRSAPKEDAERPLSHSHAELWERSCSELRHAAIVICCRPSGITPPVFRLRYISPIPSNTPPSPLFTGPRAARRKLVCKLLMAQQYSGGRQTSGMQRKECGQVPLCGNDRRQPERTGAKGACQQPGEHLHQRFSDGPGTGPFDAGVW